MRRPVLPVRLVALGSLLAAGLVIAHPSELRAAGGSSALTLQYRSTQFSLTQTSQLLAPVVAGGSGARTFSVPGTLPDGVTFDPHTGVFTGPGSWGRFASISAGRRHTCAVTDTSGVQCWGRNTNGQLGDGTTTQRSTPVDVLVSAGGPTLSGVTSVSAGGEHTCARMESGGVKCWGSNGDGRLGDGTTTQRSTPVDVLVTTSAGTPLTGVVSVSAGGSHTCALMESGGAMCWGNNGNRKLGMGTFEHANPRRTTPVDVLVSASGPTLSGIVQIVASSAHTCALMSSTGVKCWGSNEEGRTGTGAGAQVNEPRDVLTAVGGPPLSGVSSISSMNQFTCALMTSGGVKCWGRNTNGQLGDGTTTNRTTPVDVLVASDGPTLSGVTSITTGHRHTCALLTDTTMRCWGQNGRNGWLGDGTTTDRSLPVDVVLSVGGATLSEVTSVSAGEEHTCALTTTHWVKCWGNNDNGTLGDGTTSNRSTPADVVVWRAEVTVTVTDGTSSASQALQLTTTADPVELLVPLAPAGLTVATTSATSLSVEWVPPLDDGGSSIIEYQVTPDCHRAAPTDTTCVIDGVVPDTTINVGVRARNAVGVSDPTEVVITLAGAATTVTPVRPPATSELVSELAVERIGDMDRMRSAVAISERFGVAAPGTVYIASAEVFADALIAGASAGRNGGSVLLVERTHVAPEVLDELRRLSPREIVIVGGYAAVSLEVERTLAAVAATVSRIAGADRFATASELSRKEHPQGALTVHIATGVRFADAMAAGALAAVQDGPVLLVRPDGIPEVTAAELARLRPERIVIAGGTQAIGAEVELMLNRFAPQVRRIWGANRYATSVALAQNQFQPGIPMVFLASGEEFAHGLGAVAPAGRLGGPVLLTRSRCVPSAVLMELSRLRPGRVVLLGNVSFRATTLERLMHAAC